jgi:hypothetical protein
LSDIEYDSPLAELFEGSELLQLAGLDAFAVLEVAAFERLEPPHASRFALSKPVTDCGVPSGRQANHESVGGIAVTIGPTYA